MNKHKRLFFSVVLATLCLESCYVAKPLEREVHISINNDFPVTIKNVGNSNFASKHTDAEYRKSYMDELTRELINNHVIIDNVAPEFEVRILSLELHESTKLDTVKDVKSKDNGMVRELTLAGLKTSGTVLKIGGTSPIAWEADKEKDENLTNNRSVDQMIAGENKDGTTYREKAFDNNEFVVQAGHCGRRAAVRITQDVKKLLQ